MSKIVINNLCKKYNGKLAIKNLSCEIGHGELTAVVGRSGSGKSALIRTICGLDTVDAGEILMDGVVVNKLEPKDRDVAIVLKNVAIYPQLTVFENMAAGLKIRKAPKEEIDKRVKEAAKILGLTQYLQRQAKNLTAGQKQRVVLGRAIAREPKLIILDEPLEGLEQGLRAELVTEIAKLNKRLNINFIYTTQSANEALVIADKIMFVEEGELVQYATPLEIYDMPNNLPIAAYFGVPRINLLPAKLEKSEQNLYALVEGGKLKLDNELSAEALKEYVGTGRNVTLAFRAEDVVLCEENGLQIAVESVDKINDDLSIAVVYSTASDNAIRFNAVISAEQGQTVNVAIKNQRALLYDTKTENLIK